MIRGSANKNAWAVRVDPTDLSHNKYYVLVVDSETSDNAFVVTSYVDSKNFWFSGLDMAGKLTTTPSVVIGHVVDGTVIVEANKPAAPGDSIKIATYVSENKGVVTMRTAVNNVALRLRGTTRSMPKAGAGFGVYSADIAVTEWISKDTDNT